MPIKNKKFWKNHKKNSKNKWIKVHNKKGEYYLNPEYKK